MSTAWNHSPKHRKPVRDFHRQRYGNPLFPKKNQSHVVRRAPGRPQRHKSAMSLPPIGSILGILGALAAVGAAWYAIWSPAFVITDVQIQGVSPSTEQTVRQALETYENGSSLLLLPHRNVLFFGEQAAKAAIQKSVYLDSVDIQKKLPNSVTVTISEKSTKAVLDRDGHLYALDDSGFVLRELTGDEMATMGDLPPGMDSVQVAGLGAQSVDLSTLPDVNANVNAPASAKTPTAPTAPSTTPSSAPNPTTPPTPTTKPGTPPPADTAAPTPPPSNAWPLILDNTAAGAAPAIIVPGTEAFTANTMNVILQAATRLQDIAGETVRWYVPDEASDSIDATMASGWHVYLATSTPFDVQAERLSIVLKQKIGANKPNLLYVDLRYNERIFFRLKGDTQ